MKVKAVIMRPDRTNDIVVVPRRKIAGKTFTHDDVQYFLHADRFQVTWIKRWGIKKVYYSTYYYMQGVSQPLPVPHFPEVHFEQMKEPCGCDPSKPTHGVECSRERFVGIADNGTGGEELAAIFNPWFYRIIANIGPDKMSQLQFYLVIGCACGIAYIAYTLTGIKADVEALAAAGVAP